MTIERIIRIMAGFFVLLSLALGIEESPLFVSRWFLAFTAFVGFNLCCRAVSPASARRKNCSPSWASRPAMGVVAESNRADGDVSSRLDRPHPLAGESPLPCMKNIVSNPSAWSVPN